MADNFQELYKLRMKLYYNFFKMSSPESIFELQLELAASIVDAENNIKKNNNKDNFQYHLDRIYGLADSICWLFIDESVIKQLGLYESTITSLSAQEGNYLDLMKRFSEDAKGKILIFADLTRCISIGDLIEVISSDNIKLIEIKEKFPNDQHASALLRGRTGRQFSKMYWLTHYLKDEFGTLYRNKKPTKTIYVEKNYEYHYNLIPELIEKAKEEGTSIIQAEEGLAFMCQNFEFENDPSILRKCVEWGFEQPVIASTARLTENRDATVFHKPSLLFDTNYEYRVLLHEVDYSIMGVLDVEYIKGLFKSKGYGFKYIDDMLPKIEYEGVYYTLSYRFINNILSGMSTVDSTVEVMIDLLQKSLTAIENMTDDEKNYSKERPKDYKTFVSHLESNYKLKQAEDGNFIILEDVNGEEFMKIYSQN